MVLTQPTISNHLHTRKMIQTVGKLVPHGGQLTEANIKDRLVVCNSLLS